VQKRYQNIQLTIIFYSFPLSNTFSIFHFSSIFSSVPFFSLFQGDEIPIEERKKEEVLGASGSFGTVQWAPTNAHTFNPAFDVTPGELVTSIILDSGIYTRDMILKGALTQIQKS
jgi:methylthioribose-1-phosphate isomerase